MFVIPQNFDFAPYQIPNLDKIVNTFQAYIDEKEASVLKEILGYKLYKTFIDGLVALPADFDIDTTYALTEQVVFGNDIWASLVNDNTGNEPIAGANWELVEAGNQWLELKNGAEYGIDEIWIGIQKMLVPYIYSEWLAYSFASHGGNGIVIANSENSVNVSPLTRICRAWNDYSHAVGSWYDKRNTLYGFVTTNDYADFLYTYQGFKNEFGL